MGGLFSNTNSWGFEAKGKGGFFHPEKRCPNVDDCSVKGFLGTRREPKKTVKKSETWPNKGKYDPKRAKGKGK